MSAQWHNKILVGGFNPVDTSTVILQVTQNVTGWWLNHQPMLKNMRKYKMENHLPQGFGVKTPKNI